MHIKPSELCGIVSTIDPANLNNATTVGDAIDMSLFNDVMAIAIAGANDAAFDFSLTESATSGGSYTAISGKAITQETGGDDDNKQWIINLKGSEMSAGMRYVKPSVTVANGTTNLAGVVVLGFPKHGPANLLDLSSVSQIV